jgi:uncharacterized protein
MNETNGMARRYHWHSVRVNSFIEQPHTSIFGKNQGQILNLTDVGAADAKSSMLSIVKEDPGLMLPEIQKLVMPRHHDVRAADVNLKRLGSVIALAHEKELRNFESLLLLEGVGPRTIQSLALVSEIIHGTPSRFTDPARFSFAHGGKDGHPFPVPTRVYDETITILKTSVEKAKIGDSDKQTAIRNLTLIAQEMEKSFEPDETSYEKLIETEKSSSHKYGGRTVLGKVLPPTKGSNQLDLF